MFSNFPKTRPVLSEAYKRIYEQYYLDNRNGSTFMSFLSQKMESWLHKQVAKDVKRVHDKKTLEIGAGTLNQLDYEYSTYYDIVEPFKKLYENAKHLNKLENIYTDIIQIPNENRYDRIISIATFEHVTDLPFLVAKSCLLLHKNGVMRVSIPNEGYWLWKFAYKVTTGLSFRVKYKLNYEVLMRYEHVNTADEIEVVLNFFFNKVKCRYLGITKYFALYRFYECKELNITNANLYLNNQ